MHNHPFNFIPCEQMFCKNFKRKELKFIYIKNNKHSLTTRRPPTFTLWVSQFSEYFTRTLRGRLTMSMRVCLNFLFLGNNKKF